MKKMLLILTSILLLAGCSNNIFQGMDNKHSNAADELEGSSKLDSGDYDAILNNPNSNATDYAAAAMMKAGLNPVELISTLNDISESGDTNNLRAVALLKLHPDALYELQKAKQRLKDEIDSQKGLQKANQEIKDKLTLKKDLPDSDLYFQLIMTSLTDIITVIAQVGEDAGVTVTDGITADEATLIADYLVAHPDAEVDTDSDGTPDTKMVTLIADDVLTIVDALPYAELVKDPALYDSSLYSVLYDATHGKGSIDFDGDGTVSDQDITNYLNCVIGTACAIP